jgi:hypothetical protein
MVNNIIKFEGIHEYEITSIKDGGMGRVLILKRLSEGAKEPFMEALIRNARIANKYSLVYRNKLAAKTFKNNDFVEKNGALFERELNLWLNIESVNVAKLLKVVFVNRTLYALMPYYRYNLRDLMSKTGRFTLNPNCPLEMRWENSGQIKSP